MAKKCFMCGRDVTEGILCEKCDKPRKKSGATPSVEASDSDSPRKTAPHPPAPTQSQPRASAATAPAIEPDPFPKAPIINFPVESA